MVEYKMRNTNCPKCGSANLDRGRVGTKGEAIALGYVSDRHKLLSYPESIKAEVCLDCGYTELYIDIENLKRKLKK